MTCRILKSQMFEGFDVAVAEHALNMRNWRAHMARVDEDKTKPDLPAIERHIAYGRPVAPELVEAAVNENGKVDYELVDDGPSSEQVFAAKKNELLGLVTAVEQQAKHAVLPRGKHRLFAMREADIRSGTPKPGMLKSIATAVGLTSIEEPSPEDKQFLEDQIARRARISAIERAAAQAHSDIEDLTLETIDAWKMPDF